MVNEITELRGDIMQDVEQYFYKYTVVHYTETNGESKLKTVSGLTFGKTFNEVCNKIIDYFGEDTIEEMKIEFASDCDVIEEDELSELFDIKKDNQDNAELFEEIKTGLTEAIEYEKGNIELDTLKLSTNGNGVSTNK